MPIPVILPKFGFTLETADIVKWLKHDGDAVRRGDPICEVTTDKVNMEVEAPEDGTLFNLLYPEGATVPVTEIICYVLRPGEARPALTLASDNSKSLTQAVQPASPLARRIAEAANLDLGNIQGSGPGNRVMRRDVESTLSGNSKLRATPAARRLAREAGLDLSTLTGTGPRGRIQAANVAQAVQNVVATTPAQSTSVAEDVAFAPRIVKLDGMRRTIALRLQKSFQTAPHFFTEMQIDMTGIESLRHKVKRAGKNCRSRRCW